uniref:NADH dehydrogenase subunit 4L n=1 Tax=Psilochorema bidens TaxID=1968986 RepID=UPI0028D0A8A8|nr:NADH dehydrogenase subunit 4L [Psilochorema bidens]WMQ76553.1 NADH dehydrogenase subunit 4L [Psilochorema bidens]
MMILNSSYLLSLIMFLVGNFIFISNYKHLLIILLSLEFIMLSLFFFFFLWCLCFNMELYFLMLFLVLSVCEGVLVLSILVSMIRTHGNDYFYSISIL